MKFNLSYIILLLFLFTIKVQAVNYYISEDGNDNNSGNSLATPWLSLEKVIEAYSQDVFASGDSILFKRGDTFEGALLINLKDYYIGAYGEGDKPIISGMKEIEGWTEYSSNVWRAPYETENFVKHLFIDNISQPIGRYPNTGWLYYDEGNGRNQIIDNDFGFADNHFQNGNCVIKHKRWIIDALKISSHSSTTIDFENNATYTLDDGWAYFVQNHPNTLDIEGEWCFLDGYIYLYSESNPSSYHIAASYYESGTEFRNSYGTVENLNFIGFSAYGIKTEWNCRDITIKNCEVEYIGFNAIEMRYVSPNLLLYGNKIEQSGSIGIRVSECDVTDVSHNNLKNIGIIPGMGTNGNSTYNGISIEGGSGHKIHNNKVQNVGYSGIVFSKSPKVEIYENIIDSVCLIKDDGGGIYTWAAEVDESLGGHTIEKNIISNVIGSEEGVNDQMGLFAFGIYIDDRSINVNVKNNILHKNTRAMYIHNSQGVNFNGNVLADNQHGILFRKQNDNDVINNTVQNNVFLSTTDEGIYETTPYDLHNYFIRLRANVDLLDGSMNNRFDNNIYCTPFYTEDYIAIDCPTDRVGRYNMEQFRQNTIHAQNSKTGPILWDETFGIDKEEFVLFEYAGQGKKTVELNDYYLTHDSGMVYSQVQIDPYEWIVLFKEPGKNIDRSKKPEGDSVICSENTSSEYFISNVNEGINLFWQLLPSNAGVITSVDTTASIEWNPEYKGEAILRVMLCNNPEDCDLVSLPLEIAVNAVYANFDYEIDNKKVEFKNTSVQFSDCMWDFGDGNSSLESSPTHTYENEGVYSVSLIINGNDCGADTLTQSISVSSAGMIAQDNETFSIYPNPAESYITVSSFNDSDKMLVEIFALTGIKVYSRHVEPLTEIDISFLNPGFYFFRVNDEKTSLIKKILVK